MSKSTITRNGITLCKFEQLGAVGLYIDHVGGWRLHTGAEQGGFRGYASADHGRWNVLAFCKASGFKFDRRGYKTEAGARRALIRCAGRVEG